MALDIDVSRRVGPRDIAVRIQSVAGITALFGPSGVGKTTVLNMIAGLIRPDRGHIQVGDTILFDREQSIDLPPHRRDCGYVFQDNRLFPHLRVRANLLYGRRGPIAINLNAIIDLLGIGCLLDRWPATLSGGEAQRVAIGRTLLSNPRLLLLDEPLSSLDGSRKAELLALILEIYRQTAIPILYVSHDERELSALNAHIIALAGH
ncbi:ATP-binding cassette domain-containing protein [Sphingobium scionense]|uniref:Molybdate transport system ATP-binding protein n=1 Tax=Sphingobium scionense TaxID=1404341 RepID=A0A7W6PVH9_9SPHN|nr:ATP-binding cassette domain-containing protein [Sphingobium scionense]MBB4149425.1 molybdate transport system ATP-binding protein [Sphingobium scionense]